MCVSNMLKNEIQDVKSKCSSFTDFYEINSLNNEIGLWYDIWKDKKLTEKALQDLELCDVIKEANDFFPSIKHALEIAMAQPCTTCNIERSFSTLRRVKTWIRSTMNEDRLNGKKFNIQNCENEN